MTEYAKVILALQQVNNLSSLLKDNKWKNYIYHNLITIEVELNRQLSVLTGKQISTKIEEQSTTDNGTKISLHR